MKLIFIMKQFSEQELHDIYNTSVKKPGSYFTKYEKLPPCPVKAWNYSWDGHDFPRSWCILDFCEWIEKYNINPDHVGHTSWDPETEFLPYKTRQLIEYPPYDLHTIGNHFDKAFDFFLFSQTLEHLYNPHMAVESIYKTIKPGGYVFTSVPTLNIPHMTPIHYGGYNPMGLAVMFASAGFEILEIGQWGNLEYIQKLWTTHYWPGYEALQKNGRVTNSECDVCQCWILARRPLE